MRQTAWVQHIRALVIGVIFCMGMASLASADVYVNVMAVNGSSSPKQTAVKQNLPGELKAEDILDANGLQVDYDFNDGNYFVHGTVNLEPKESKTFKIRVRDLWKISPEYVSDIKKQIDEGYESVGKVRDPQKAEQLRNKINSKLDYIVDLQNAKSDSVEKRIDSYRSYSKEIKRIQNDALSVDYWRSDPGKEEQQKIVHFNIEVENPATNPTKVVKEKNYLPGEIKPEHVVEAEGFEVRYDEGKQQSFLFKEEELTSGQKKKYTIGILDIWTIPQRDVDYLRTRSAYAYDFLKDSKFEASAKTLLDRVNLNLANIETSQAQNLPIMEHISSFRANTKTYADAKQDVESMEKLLSVFREDLDKSKVDNILQKMQALKGVNDVSKAVFSKKFEQTTTWSFIGWVLVFVALVTIINLVIWLMRSKETKIKEEEPAAKVEAPAKPAQK